MRCNHNLVPLLLLLFPIPPPSVALVGNFTDQRTGIGITGTRSFIIAPQVFIGMGEQDEMGGCLVDCDTYEVSDEGPSPTLPLLMVFRVVCSSLSLRIPLLTMHLFDWWDDDDQAYRLHTYPSGVGLSVCLPVC